MVFLVKFGLMETDLAKLGTVCDAQNQEFITVEDFKRLHGDVSCSSCSLSLRKLIIVTHQLAYVVKSLQMAIRCKNHFDFCE